MEESCDEGGAGEGEGALTRFRETGAIRKNSTACTSHNLRTTASPNVSVPRLAWKLRGGAARHDIKQRGRTRQEEGKEGGRGRRTERRRRWWKRGNGRWREKETRYILYDSVIAFPRTNTASRPSGRKKTSTLIVALSFFLYLRPFFLTLFPFLSRPCNPSSFFTVTEFLRGGMFVKRSLWFFAFHVEYRVSVPSFRILSNPLFLDPASIVSSKSEAKGEPRVWCNV